MYNLLNENCKKEQTIQAISVLKKTLKAAHQINVVTARTAQIRAARESDEYNFCFNTAQKLLKKYKNLINSYSLWTNIKIINITEAEARKKDIYFWKSTLEFVEMIIYVEVAVQFGLKSMIEDKFKQVFQEVKN